MKDTGGEDERFVQLLSKCRCKKHCAIFRNQNSACSCQRQETRCSSAGCPFLQMPPGQSAIVQDVPLDSLTRAERSQGTLYPRADCPLLVQNVPPHPTVVNSFEHRRTGSYMHRSRFTGQTLPQLLSHVTGNKTNYVSADSIVHFTFYNCMY